MNPTRRNAQSGMAAAEFALVLPVLMLMFYGCIEATRFILVTQKAEKLAHTVADVTAQSTQVTLASLNQMMEATDDIMDPFDFRERGVVVISSLYRTQGEAGGRVNWRYRGGGDAADASRFGAVGATPDMPPGFTFEERENVIAVEVFFRWRPMLSGRFFDERLIYRQAFYKPRFGALITAPG